MSKKINFRSFTGLPAAWLPVFLFIMGLSISCKPSKVLDVLVITGGHAYDTLEFREMFGEIGGLNPSFALKPDAWNMLASGETYDALIFYDMWMDISAAEKQTFLQEFKKGTGMVFLHHSLVSHQDWPEYTRLVGGKYYHQRHTPDTKLHSQYRHDITLEVKVSDPTHPVTKGMNEFDIFDEGYSKIMVDPEVKCLLETDHPDCHPCIGWTHKAYNSKVVYLMGGHDKHAYANQNFRQLIYNAVHYTSQE